MLDFIILSVLSIVLLVLLVLNKVKTGNYFGAYKFALDSTLCKDPGFVLYFCTIITSLVLIVASIICSYKAIPLLLLIATIYTLNKKEIDIKKTLRDKINNFLKEK